MHLAVTNLFKAHWTDQIHQEWIRALLRKDNRYDRATLEKTRDLMDRHVFDAKVTGYEKLIPILELPDPDDRHVLAAAIKAGADAIITYNLKDFPSAVLAEYAIEALHPDDFIYCQIDLSSAVACGAVKRHRESLKKPTKTKAEYLETLSKQALPQTVSELKDYIDLI